MPEWTIIYFPISGVETWFGLPLIVAFMVSFFSSMVGISGAFLLLPFQMSVLGFTSPAVSATNLVFNLIAIPGGVWSYIREKRMVWPLTGIIVAGTLPGVLFGYHLRIVYLPDPAAFKLFVGCVLLYLGIRLLLPLWPGKKQTTAQSMQTIKNTPSPLPATPAKTVLPTCHSSMREIAFVYNDEIMRFNTLHMFLLALVVGVIGGMYGIGGGAIIAPFCVAVFRLPIHAIAGAALAGTLFTSVAGVLVYSLLPAPPGLSTAPDWMLGTLFGLGGIGGMYLGARCQKHIPQKILQSLLGSLLCFLAIRYITA
ncbi:sulfite exporter TauE/SafE family protein [Candidatus Magnetaquicoccus inordinatus]|uniref:sulfite exporter TauE/SafE family protein n=1 Tax=Candidatus Magnetaquicoccus inordinatus TaxID=2496818 RepID=UPI00102C45CF